MVFGRLYILYTVIFELTLLAHVTHSHIHVCMPSFKTDHDAQTNTTLRAKTVYSLFCSSLYTHSNDVVFLLRANAGNVSLPGDRWTRPPSRYATCIHILLVGFCNLIKNEKLPEPFVFILPPHVLWSRKALRMVISVRWKNSFLVHFHVLLAIL